MSTSGIKKNKNNTNLIYQYFVRIAVQLNKITPEVKEKLQTVMEDVVSQLDVNKMITDQKIKWL